MWRARWPRWYLAHGAVLWATAVALVAGATDRSAWFLVLSHGVFWTTCAHAAARGRYDLAALLAMGTPASMAWHGGAGAPWLALDMAFAAFGAMYAAASMGGVLRDACAVFSAGALLYAQAAGVAVDTPGAFHALWTLFIAGVVAVSWADLDKRWVAVTALVAALAFACFLADTPATHTAWHHLAALSVDASMMAGGARRVFTERASVRGRLSPW